ncbi:uncharacterized protein LOC133354372 [Lethenteron reissneri]|uniref:uncharacterized protein LOC133354372 n=1 Tax=Lethenteron reissneri TaxID=7753 RepID=UPI002AB769D4|nr:uncharacterized protein LOC133354372 [Lethenteron reissneri]
MGAATQPQFAAPTAWPMGAAAPPHLSASSAWPAGAAMLPPPQHVASAGWPAGAAWLPHLAAPRGQWQRRLPDVAPFVAQGGDWSAFQDRFDAAYMSVGWSMEEALPALPTCLDERALQAFKSIHPANRATLPAAYIQMANVFEPPSTAQLKFSLRRREEGELPLAFRCSLLALAQAAYPDLYGRALDSMALGKLLDLARELGIALSINNDRQITSLAVAENIQAHLSLRQRPQMAACAGILAPDGGDTLAALAMPDRRGRGTGDRRPEQRGRPGPSRPQEADTVACFRCGQRGHIERGCRNAPGAFGKGTPPSPRPSLASGSGPQAPPE